MTWVADNTGGPKRPPVAPNINPHSTVFLPLTVPPRRMRHNTAIPALEARKQMTMETGGLAKQNLTEGWTEHLEKWGI